MGTTITGSLPCALWHLLLRTAKQPEYTKIVLNTDPYRGGGGEKGCYMVLLWGTTGSKQAQLFAIPGREQKTLLHLLFVFSATE